MTHQLRSVLRDIPLIAILRGIQPDEVEGIGEALVDAGFRLIEVPLNSPRALDSIERLAQRVGARAIIGAGTVLTPKDVRRVKEAGGRMIVSPNTDPGVISATVVADMISCPGYFTMTEAFSAIRAGAHMLKIFPAEAVDPSVLRAQRAVLPREVPVLIVGGVSSEGMGIWRDAGASGFGIGSGLYKSGYSAAEVAERSRRFVAGWRDLPAV